MVKFSVIYLTYRMGGYDLLADGLANQTCQDYELICVDEMTQHTKVRDSYLRGRGVNLSAIIPSKKKCFPDTAYNLINAYNTGVMKSRGEYIIIMNDYSWLPPNALEMWERNESKLKNNTAISGIGVISYACESPEIALDLTNPISVWSEESSVELIKQIYAHKEIGTRWIPTEFEMFYSAFSYDLLIKINGFQECYDYANNDQIAPVVSLVKMIGGKLAVDKNCRLYFIEHRRFAGDPGLWHLSKKKPPEGSCLEKILRPNCFDLRTHVRGTIP